MNSFTNFVIVSNVVAFDHDVILLGNGCRVNIPVAMAIKLYDEIAIGDQVIVSGTLFGTGSGSFENILTAEHVGLIK